ncbi:hypothetical protein [Pseudomonas alabamensis]|uniref:hypothetical protein n=1 Tax=Pseudomonas alabamensis TaxID=3064349 RepID=UPI003F64EDF0
MKVKTVSASDTAYILRGKLGAVRAWDHMLSDMRRGKSSYFGLCLTPYLSSHDGKALRPYYRLQDIAEFISAALSVAPSSTALIPLQTYEFEVAPSDKRVWKRRVVA